MSTVRFALSTIVNDICIEYAAGAKTAWKQAKTHNAETAYIELLMEMAKAAGYELCKQQSPRQLKFQDIQSG